MYVSENFLIYLCIILEFYNWCRFYLWRLVILIGKFKDLKVLKFN